MQGVLKLLEASDRFCFIKLKDSLISQLSSLINSSTVIQLLVSAFNLNIPGVSKLHVVYIVLYKTIVLDMYKVHLHNVVQNV